MSVSHMKPIWTRIHVQTSFHRVTPCIQFLPSRIEPGFGYIYVYRPDQCPAPVQGSPNLTQIGLGVSQAGPTMRHTPLRRAPQGGILVLLGLRFRPCFFFMKGRGIGGWVRESLAAANSHKFGWPTLPHENLLF